MHILKARSLPIIGAYLSVVATFAHAAPTVTLQQLFAGESIAIGNAQFTNWELVSLDATAAPVPDLSRILVSPSVDAFGPGLDFVANGQLAVTGINSLDIAFKYQLRSLDPARPFNSQTLELTGTAITAGGGLTFVTDEVSTSSGTDLASLLAIDDQTSGFQQEFDLANFAPSESVSVVTNIFVSGVSESSSVRLFSLNQSFIQAGPDLLPGDYNNNGTVDAADYTLWRDHLGAPAGTLANDIDGGPIGQDQYETWRENFGESGGGALSASAVPEPITLLLLLPTILFSLRTRRRV